ncbi:MAG: orotidine-5'-phosphate decarboxylase [Anaerolineales bacterium]|jgi:uridine monophosphate synthetase
MENFFSLLEKRVEDCSSLLCIGLDPHVSDLPEPTAAAALKFCLDLVTQTSPYAAAFKPNAAFFEALGPDGWRVLKELIAAIASGSSSKGSRIPVILDAKRGDIASTAEAYARSAFKALAANAITLSPYLGRDSIEPFLTDPERGIFLLCKTSNPGSGDLQDLVLQGGGSLYEQVAILAQSWNTRGNVGLVVAATAPEALAHVRAAAPNLWFLVPGVGTQGGELEAALRAGLRADGKGLLINVSRGVARSADPARAAADLRDAILTVKSRLAREGPSSWRPGAALADGLLEAGCVKFGSFTLKSGLKSPIYLDLRQLVTSPGLLARVAAAYRPILNALRFDRLAGLPYAALPIATAISLQGGYPLIYPRKEAKAYGTKAEIEGEYRPGETVVVIDDLATTGESKFEAIEKLGAAGLRVQDVVVLIDRQSGAKGVLEARGIRLHAVLTITEMLDHWEGTGRVDKEKIAATREFLKANP